MRRGCDVLAHCSQPPLYRWNALPLGRRGAGGEARYGYERRPIRTAVEEANAEGMVVVQIASHDGGVAIDAIAAVPGLDVVCVGPQDLSICLGVPCDFDHPSVVDTLRRVVAACAPTTSPSAWSSARQAPSAAGTG